MAQLFSPGSMGETLVSTGGTHCVSITPTADTVIKAAPGRLCRVVVTTANGANPIKFYDNASAGSGKVIAAVPASAAIGSVYDFQMPADNGITAGATVSAGTLAVSVE